jgi:hypothetical protein
MDNNLDVLAEALADTRDAITIASDEKLKAVETQILRQVELEDLKDSLEEQLKQCNKDLEQVQDKLLPDALMEAGCSKFTTTDGFGVKLSAVYFPSILKADEAAVYDELAEMGHAGIINTNIMVPLGKGGHEEAKTLIEVIRPYLNKYSPVLDEAIHWATFRAFAKEQIESAKADAPEGEEPEKVLPDKIKVHNVMRAKVTRPKQR